VHPEEVVDVDYSVEEAFKFIVSSGIVGKDLAPPRKTFADVPTPVVQTFQS
jgi:uncharacterized membrane protein